MKKFSIFAIAALLLVAFSMPAMAKVNLSGALWVTYWAQQESNNLTYQSSTGAGWVDVGGNNDAPLIPQSARQQNNKSFILGQNVSNGNLQASAVNAPGFLLVADCPVTDWVKGYAELSANSNALQLTAQEAYINLAFMKELGLTAGIMEVPFGREHLVRPDAGVEEVFISEYSQDANGLLQTTADAGLKISGTVGSGLIGGGVGAIDYDFYFGNGSAPTVAYGNAAEILNGTDTTAVTGGRTGLDNNDAKQFGLNLCIKPISGLYVGGSYFAGDYNNLLTTDSRSKFTAYDLNAGYDVMNVLLLSAEYSRSSHDKMLHEFIFGTTVPGSTTGLTNAEEAEWIIKAIYDGVQDFEFGIRYSVVDPKNIESEIAAGYASEDKLSFAAEYKFARSAVLKAEYSMVDNNLDYIERYDPAQVAGRTSLTQSVDPNDDIMAIQLGLQF